MNDASILDVLFPRVRSQLLAATLLHAEHWWFMTELARHLEVTPSSLQRELEALASAGVLLRRQDGRRSYFKANTDSPLFADLHALFEKTAGVEAALRDALETFGERIELALLYGSFARGEEHAGSDIDLLIVGPVRQIDLLSTLRCLERSLRREVHATIFSTEEFRRKLASGDHFLTSVLQGEYRLLKGEADELGKAA